jgi:succinate dehydrogenase/fumarate reductase-like Fe-S protein
MSVCPELKEGHWNDYAGPAAFAAIAQRHLDTIDESDRLGQAVFSGLFKCQECGNCSLVCPSKIPVSEINIQMKQEARARGFEYDPAGRTLH